MDVACILKELPPEEQVAAARTACEVNPANAPPETGVQVLANMVGTDLQPEHLALMTSKYWGSSGVRLTVGFLDSPPVDLRNRILDHANAWGEYANVEFKESNIDPQIRIARVPGEGYFSYLGTDILRIPRSQQTMNLDSFSMGTPDSEFRRVVRHEFGHSLGMVHEHQRRAIIELLDVEKTVAWGAARLRWSRQQVIQQILTPLEERALLGSPEADQTSIMAYMLPASITRNGLPIQGGADISLVDQVHAAKVYPKPLAPKPPEPPAPPVDNCKRILAILRKVLEESR